MAFGDCDLRIFFADTGVPVSFGGVSSYSDGAPIKGNFDRPVQIKLADQGYGGVEAAFPVVHLPYNAFNPMPIETNPITVDGTAYTVGEVTAEGDGAVVSLELKAATL
jgi:hypothetical protein